MKRSISGGVWKVKIIVDFCIYVCYNIIVNRKGIQNMEYKGYFIEVGFYGEGEITVQYCGDDIWFKSVEEAKEFIDQITEE